MPAQKQKFRLSAALIVATLAVAGGVFAVANSVASESSKKLIVRIWPRVHKARSQQPIDIDLRVVNTSDKPQSIRVMSCSWSSSWKSNDRRVGLQGRDCWSNIREDVTLNPGEAYTKAGSIKIDVLTPKESVSFKLGFTSIGSNQTLWSNAATIVVESTGVVDPPPNP